MALADALDTLVPFWTGARRNRGAQLLRRLDHKRASPGLVMDCAYEIDETRQLALDLGSIPVVPPLKTRRNLVPYAIA